jgi:cobalt-zinc-cadmium resistance protein CzcA
MRRGAQSIPTIKRVEAEVDKVNAAAFCRPGVSIERIYDRSDLIRVTTHTVLHNMIAGIVLIFLLQWLFLGNVRSAVIVAMTIPFALSFAIGSWCCAASRPICCRWAPSISAWWSMPR